MDIGNVSARVGILEQLRREDREDARHARDADRREVHDLALALGGVDEKVGALTTGFEVFKAEVKSAARIGSMIGAAVGALVGGLVVTIAGSVIVYYLTTGHHH